MKYDKQYSINETEKILRTLGIDKSLDKCYGEYCDGKKRLTSYKAIEHFNRDHGVVFSVANPYNIYNQFYYYDGVNN